MIVVLFATILAPTFAWEVGETRAAHAEPEGIDERHAQDEQGDAIGEEDPHILYGCAGHVLGHLAWIGEAHDFPYPGSASQARIPARPQHHLQRFPKRLERPPSTPVRT